MESGRRKALRCQEKDVLWSRSMGGFLVPNQEGVGLKEPGFSRCVEGIFRSRSGRGDVWCGIVLKGVWY